MNISYFQIKTFTKTLITISILTLINSFTCQTIKAQITPDNSLGSENSIVIPDQIIKELPSDLIEGGATRGSNLFHSFSEFNIKEGRGAYFNNPEGIVNILTRITGGNISEILGTLGVLGNANFFLINPNGIIFGPNASLDVNGAFLGSTADSILFDNYEFSASNPNIPPILTINAPIGLNYRENSGDITSSANLNLTNDFTLEGENLSIGGVISSEGGDLTFSAKNNLIFQHQVDIYIFGSLGRDITVKSDSLISMDGGFIGIINEGEGNAGNIKIEAPTINIDGDGFGGFYIDNLGNGNGGTITVKTNKLSINNDGFIQTGTYNKGNAGDITVSAENISLTDTSFIASFIFGEGNSGKIDINTSSLSLLNGSQISVEVEGAGNAEPININAESIILDGVNKDDRISGILSEVFEDAEGSGGEINIVTDSLKITNGAQVRSSTSGFGNGGLINIEANTISIDGFDLREKPIDVDEDDTTAGKGFPSAILTEVLPPAEADGGIINIHSDTLSLTNGGRIAATTGSIGNSGFITIIANSIFLDGEGSINRPIEARGSNITVQTVENAEGDGGEINLKTDELTLTNQSKISATSEAIGNAGDINIDSQNTISILSGSVIESLLDENAVGNAGKIDITTGNLLIDNGRISTSTLGLGNAGTITINSNLLQLNNSAQIQSFSDSSGNAGDINLNVNNDFNLDNSSILASTTNQSLGEGGNINISVSNNVNLNNDALIGVDSQGEGDGGNIFLQANNLFLDNNSTLSAATFSGEGGNINLQVREIIKLNNMAPITATAGGTGNGGNIDMNTKFLILSNQSNITANAFEGKGGNIVITASGIFLKDSQITASSELGIDGIVETNTPEVDPSRGIIELPQQVVDPSALIAQNVCQQSENSEFTMTGKGGLPITPFQLLESDLTNIDLLEPINQEIAPSQDEDFKIPNSYENKQSKIPARGWIKNEQGKVVLVNYNPHKQSYSLPVIYPKIFCPPQN